MVDYKLIMEGSVVFDISADEFKRFNRKRATTGRHFPLLILDNGSYIFMDKVVAVVPTKLIIQPEAANASAEQLVEDAEKIVEDPVEVIAETADEELDEEKLAKTEKGVMAEIVAKSACTHKEVSLYFQKTKKGTRYFPVCDFCGHRGRYVASDAITETEIAEAIEWKEK